MRPWLTPEKSTALAAITTALKVKDATRVLTTAELKSRKKEDFQVALIEAVTKKERVRKSVEDVESGNVFQIGHDRRVEKVREAQKRTRKVVVRTKVQEKNAVRQRLAHGDSKDAERNEGEGRQALRKVRKGRK